MSGPLPFYFLQLLTAASLLFCALWTCAELRIYNFSGSLYSELLVVTAVKWHQVRGTLFVTESVVVMQMHAKARSLLDSTIFL